MARILLAGCGAIGQQLGQQLITAGHEVFGLRRSAVNMPFTMIQGDLSQPLPTTLLPHDLDYVIYTATPSERSDAGYQAAYPSGCANVLQALQKQTLKRFIFVSSTAVYQQDDGSWVDESSPTQPQRYNGIRVLEAEQLLTKANVASTCVRFGGIYGRGRNWLLSRVKEGAQVQTQPPKYTNRIHQDDCVGVLAFLIEQSERNATLDDVYVAVDDDPACEETLCNWLAEQLHAPKPLIKPAAPGAGQNKRCRNQRLKQAGYPFIYPTFREGYQAIICASQ